MTAPTVPAEDAATETTTGHTGGMIALVPANPENFAVPGGDPVEEMHMTLAYLGDDLTGIAEDVVTALKAWALEATQYRTPIEGRIFAHAVWNVDDGSEGPDHKEPATVYEIETTGSWELAELSHWARDRARDIMGSVAFPPQFPFKPHVTAGYNLDVSKLSATGPVVFDRLRIAIGNEVTDFPLLGQAYNEDPYCYPDGCYTTQSVITAAADGTPVTEDGTAVPAPNLDADNSIPVHFPVIVVEGMSTSDGRFIVPGSLGHRALPLPILAQTRNPDGGDGHDGAEVVGRLDVLTRTPGEQVISKETGEPFPAGTFVWSGSGVGDPDTEGIKKAMKGYLTGNSVDLSDVAADFVFDEEDPDPFAGPTEIRMTAGKIAATTLVPIPAFADAYVQFDGATPAVADDLDPALVASAAWTSADIGDVCFPCAAGLTTVTASAAVEDLPPMEWFTDPQLDGPTPLTVTEEGRVYGHIAQWNTCHIGFQGQCIKPPKSASDYTYFHTGGAQVNRDGERAVVAVGHLTLGTGHAHTSLKAGPAAEHYDNTGTQAARVAAGEDEHGIWIAGALKEGLTDQAISELRASPISGDWRNIDGSLELVAALGVNVPGFPVPRARVASGAPFALVAAGVVPVPEKSDTTTGAKTSPNEDEAAQAERIADLVVAKLQAAEQDDDVAEAPVDGADTEASLAYRMARSRLLIG